MYFSEMMANDETVELLTHGPFTITAGCGVMEGEPRVSRRHYRYLRSCGCSFRRRHGSHRTTAFLYDSGGSELGSVPCGTVLGVAAVAMPTVLVAATAVACCYCVCRHRSRLLEQLGCNLIRSLEQPAAVVP